MKSLITYINEAIDNAPYKELNDALKDTKKLTGNELASKLTPCRKGIRPWTSYREVDTKNSFFGWSNDYCFICIKSNNSFKTLTWQKTKEKVSIGINSNDNLMFFTKIGSAMFFPLYNVYLKELTNLNKFFD